MDELVDRMARKLVRLETEYSARSRAHVDEAIRTIERAHQIGKRLEKSYKLRSQKSCLCDIRDRKKQSVGSFVVDDATAEFQVQRLSIAAFVPEAVLARARSRPRELRIKADRVL